MARPKSEGFVRKRESEKRLKRTSGTYVTPVAKRTPAQKQVAAKDTAKANRRKAKQQEAARYPRDPGARAKLSKPARKKAERIAVRANVGTTEKYEQGQRKKAFGQLLTGKRRLRHRKEIATPTSPRKLDIRDTTISTDRERKAVNKYLANRKTKGDKVLDVLDDVYKYGDKAIDSVGPGIRKALEAVPSLKLSPSKAVRNRGGSVEVRKSTKKESKAQTKALGKLATSPLKATGAAAEGVGAAAKEVTKNVRIANRKADKNIKKVPGGKMAVKAMGPVSDTLTAPFKAAAVGGKALWYSDEVIKAAATGKSPKNIVKASQGKEKTSGQSIAKSLGVDPKKHKGANILVGGAVDLGAQLPLAAASGGSGTAAQMAAKSAARTTLKAEARAEVKKAGVKKFADLPEKTRAKVRAKQEAAAEEAAAHATGKYGKRRELYAGIDVRVPFARGKRIQKLAPVSRPVTKARVGAQRKIVEAEAKGSKWVKPVTAAQKKGAKHATSLYNRLPRNIRGDVGEATRNTGRETRAKQALVERDTQHLFQALSKVADTKDPQKKMLDILDEIENAPNITSPEAKQLHEAWDQAHQEMVKKGLSKEYGGQKLVDWDYKQMSKAARSNRRQLHIAAKEARKETKTAKANAKLKATDTSVGAKAATSTSDEVVAGANERRRGQYEKIADRHETNVTRANQEVEKINTKLRGLATRPNSDTNIKLAESLKRDRLDLLDEARVSRNAAKSARRGASRSARTATQQRRLVGRVDVKRSQEKTRQKFQNIKAHRELEKEFQAAPATKSIEETRATLEDFAHRFEALGDAKTAKFLRDKIDSKAKEPLRHTPRTKLEAENPIKRPSRQGDLPEKRNESRILRHQDVRTFAKENPDADLTPERIANEVQRMRSAANTSEHWKKIADNIVDQGAGEGHKWYAITPEGVSKPFESVVKKNKEGKDVDLGYLRAKRKTDEFGGKAVRLDDESRKFITREGQLHQSDFSNNEYVTGWRRTVGGWKRIAISTPTNMVRNLSGDTMRAVAIGGAGGLHTKDTIKVLQAERKRQKVERTVSRFSDGMVTKNHRVSDANIEKAMNATVTIGQGKTKSQVTVGELLERMEKQGITESGMIRSDVLQGQRKAGEVAGEVHKTGPLEKWDRGVSAREMASRSHLFMNALSSGLTDRQAAEVVRRALIDYGNVSAFEEAARRNLIPFIVFKGRNIATWGGHFIRKPGKLKQYQTVFDTTAQLAGFKDQADFEEQVGQFAQTLPIPLPTGVSKVLGVNAINLSLPVGDLYNTYKQVTDNNRIGTAVGQQLFAGRLLVDLLPRVVNAAPTSTSSKQLPVDKKVGEFLMKQPKLVKFFRLSKGKDFDGNPAYFGHPAIMNALGMTPESGALARAGTSEGPWYLPIINFFTGTGATTLKPGTGELQKIRTDLKNIEIDVENPTSDAKRKALYKKQANLRKRRDELYAGQGVPWAVEKAGGKSTSKSSSGLPAGWK